MLGKQMLNKLEVAQQQWGGANQVIDAWLLERQEVLVSYCELAGLPPYNKLENTLPQSDDVKRFCQLLLDYISAGHFEIFDNIVASCQKKGPESSQKAKQIYPLINKSTDFALQFNDKYAENENFKATNGFDESLARLGGLLDDRFELEDKLIQILYQDHS